MVSLRVNKANLRWVLLVGSFMVGGFLIIDFTNLPEILQHEYIISRFAFQIPSILLLLAFTFHKKFDDYQQLAVLATVIVITFANYWLIQQSWIKAQFAFSYEGTLLYTFFAFFVMRLNFQYGIFYVLLSLMGFGALVIKYPVYGSYNSINFGFVAMAQCICLVGLYNLTKSLKEVESLTEKLQELSRVDQLSGLLNRRAYEHDSNVQLELAKRAQIPISVFLTDIDNFKDYNDAYGHQKGDEAIRHQADILQNIFRRETDVVGRFGGEEFIVIANDMTSLDAQTMAQRILDEWLAKSIDHGKGDGGHHVSCSIGIISIVPDKRTTLKRLVGAADSALYKAKNDGRNCYYLHPIPE